MAPASIPSSLLTSHPSSLPDVQCNPISMMSPKPIVMPTQNYALMQVAGQEGTFSLVPLPQVPPPISGHQPRISIPDNLKLPIPRYQSLRKKFSKNAPRYAVARASCKTSKRKVCADVQLMTVTPVDNSESSSTEVASEKVVFIESVSTEVTDTPSLIEGTTAISITEPGNATDIATHSGTGFSEPQNISCEPVIAKCLQQNALSVNIESEVTKDLIIGCEKTSNETDPATDVSHLSSNTGSAVQLIEFPLTRKLPILSYSRMKSTGYSNSEEISDVIDPPLPVSKSEPKKALLFLGNSNLSSLDVIGGQPFSDVCRQASSETTCPPTKCRLENQRHQKVGTGRRRGRKRKTADGILVLQSKRKIYNCNRLGDNGEKIKVGCPQSKHKNPEAFKKYRSIMPKPVLLVQALTSVNSPADLMQTPNRDCSEQGIIWDSTLSYKQTDKLCSETSIISKGVQSVSKPWHKCHICNRTFQFKHHLEDHMNTHMNRRPYSCRLCRKAYVHSGSLNTHMKLHHSESRLKKLIPCEFCSKVFGHVRVYFGHLKEVHRVIIGTEVATTQHEFSETVKKSRLTGVKVEEQSSSLERETASNVEDEFLKIQANQDEVKLQIKCGRCQLTTPTFSDMKFHLLCDHGEEIQGHHKEGVLQTKGAQEELFKHAALLWKQLNEKRNLVKCDHCEEFCSFPKLKKHVSLFHPDSHSVPVASKMVPEPVKEQHEADFAIRNKEARFCCGSGLNCVLCKQVFPTKEDLFAHWQNQHNCEDPPVLWTIFRSYFEQDK
ncbi:zinc finger protein 438 isoform X2 [Ambystoma mexicanum]